MTNLQNLQDFVAKKGKKNLTDLIIKKRRERIRKKNFFQKIKTFFLRLKNNSVQ